MHGKERGRERGGTKKGKERNMKGVGGRYNKKGLTLFISITTIPNNLVGGSMERTRSITQVFFNWLENFLCRRFFY